MSTPNPVPTVESRLATLEAAAKKEEVTIVGWIKTNWLHLVNATGVIATVLKVFGKL